MRKAAIQILFCFALAAAVGLGPHGAGTAEPPIRVTDEFESEPINLERWWLGQIRRYRHWIDPDVVRTGRGALAIRVKANDDDCDGECQRNEIRIANSLRLNFGVDAWYGFSFRIDGDVPGTGSSRWVIGQWKEETNHSPFLAQRFDNGVFHVTVEDNGCRVLVAQAEGDTERFLALQRSRSIEAFRFLSDAWRFACDPDVRIEYGPNPILPNPYETWIDMAYRVRGGRNEQGVVEIWANGRFIARVTGSIGHEEISGPTQYFKIGMYRAPLPGTATIYFDNFRRGGRREEVDPSLLYPR